MLVASFARLMSYLVVLGLAVYEVFIPARVLLVMFLLWFVVLRDIAAGNVTIWSAEITRWLLQKLFNCLNSSLCQPIGCRMIRNLRNMPDSIQFHKVLEPCTGTIRSIVCYQHFWQAMCCKDVPKVLYVDCRCCCLH